MKTKRFFSVLLMNFLLLTILNGQSNKSTKDYLNVPGPLRFSGASYNLARSSHPNENFYKHEYLIPGEKAERFNTMILLDVITGTPNIEDIVDSKVAELNKMKETNPVVNYQVFQKNDEYILDFLLSGNAPDGKTMSIVERNVYRYKIVTDKSGQKALLLFGVSTRAYDNNITRFLTELKVKRSNLTNEVAKYILPQLAIAK